MYDGEGSLFVLGSNLPRYYRREHPNRGADPSEEAVSDAFRARPDGGGGVFLVELQSGQLLPPRVPGCRKVEQRSIPGIASLIVAVDERLRG